MFKIYIYIYIYRSLYINISTDVTDYSPLKDLEYLTEM